MVDIDYSKTFAPMAKMTSIRLTLAIAAAHGWDMHQMDVKSAFLHEDLEEEIYMEQPPRFVQNSSLVCRLRKSIYGLKQAPRAWYAKIDSFLLASRFTQCYSDPNVYFLQQDDSLLILVLYVDDFLITRSSPSIITMVKDALQDRFAMTDLGLLHYFLGIEISQSNSGITLAQPKYALDLLVRFHMADCKPSPTPFLSGVKLEVDCSTPLVDATLYRQLVSSLIYLTHSRPDISFAVGMVLRFMQEPHELHWKATKRILCYIQGTHSFGIHYRVGTDVDLVGYTNLDWVGDTQHRKSTSSYSFSLGSGPINWSSKKQNASAISSTEAEYREVVNAATEAIWLQGILTEFGIQYKLPTVIYCDNQSIIQICKNPVQHQRIHMHFIRKLIHGQIIDLGFCPSSEQVADIFTKPFTESKFLHLRALFGVRSTSATTSSSGGASSSLLFFSPLYGR